MVDNLDSDIEKTISDENHIDNVNYKGIYHEDDKEEEYFEANAHFKYSDLYSRLEQLYQNIETERKGYIDENENNIKSVSFVYNEDKRYDNRIDHKNSVLKSLNLLKHYNTNTLNLNVNLNLRVKSSLKMRNDVKEFLNKNDKKKPKINKNLIKLYSPEKKKKVNSTFKNNLVIFNNCSLSKISLLESFNPHSTINKNSISTYYLPKSRNFSKNKTDDKNILRLTYSNPKKELKNNHTNLKVLNLTNKSRNQTNLINISKNNTLDKKNYNVIKDVNLYPIKFDQKLKSSSNEKYSNNISKRLSSRNLKDKINYTSNIIKQHPNEDFNMKIKNMHKNSNILKNSKFLLYKDKIELDYRKLQFKTYDHKLQFSNYKLNHHIKNFN